MRKSTNVTRLGIGAIAVLASAFWTGCPGTWATLSVWNNTGKAIVELYCSPTTSDTWGDSLIGQAIPAGETRNFSGFDTGEYDVLAVFADESEARIRSVDLFAGETYTWNVLLSLPSGKAEEAAAETGS